MPGGLEKEHAMDWEKEAAKNWLCWHIQKIQQGKITLLFI